MIKEGDYILVTDVDDKYYLKIGRVIETKYDIDGIMNACVVGFGYDQDGKKRCETYIHKNLDKKFKKIAFVE